MQTLEHKYIEAKFFHLGIRQLVMDDGWVCY